MPRRWHLAIFAVFVILALLLPSSVSSLSWNRRPSLPSGFGQFAVIPLADWAINSINQQSTTTTQQLTPQQSLNGNLHSNVTCNPVTCAASCPTSGGGSCVVGGMCICGSLLLNIGSVNTDATANFDVFISIWPPELSVSGYVHWTQIPSTPIMFAPRQNAALVSTKVTSSITNRSKSVVLFFGGGGNIMLFRSLWAYDVERNEFTGLGPPPETTMDIYKSCVNDPIVMWHYNGTVDMVRKSHTNACRRRLICASLC